MPDSGNHFIVTCPGCGTGNRVPVSREGVAGRCGNCGSTLPALYTKPLSLGDADFDAFVRTYPAPVLVEFWAPW